MSDGAALRRLLLSLALLLTLTGAGSVALAGGTAPLAAPSAPAGAAAGGVGGSAAGAGVLDIPVIGVHSPLLALGLAADGTVEVPPLESPFAGWYVHSPVPGDQGPAVVLGHVDSARSGPGVFYTLRSMAPGDVIEVTRPDGRVVAFRTDRVATFPKATFPTDAVYGDLDHAGLRLITCGGAFDRSARSYEDNVVVFASALPPGSRG